MIGVLLMLVTTAPVLDAPPPRGHTTMVYDEGRAKVVIAGGLVFKGSGGQDLTLLDDLWTWDGKTWQRLTAAGPKMAGQALAYDTKRRRLLEFGGWLGGSKESGDLYAITDQGSTIVASTPDLERADCPLVYDVKRDRLVLFGTGKGRDETWEFDGRAWSPNSAKGPDGKAYAKMVYDSVRHRIVLFNGSLEGQRFGKTWEFDGSTWRLVTSSLPGPRVWLAGLVFDEKRKRTVMFGGMGRDGDQPGTFGSETWAYDGATWKKIASTGPSGLEAAMAYDKKRDRIVLYGVKSHDNGGGGTQTWEFDGSKWEQKQ